MNTLRGVFPDPREQHHRRNFILENMRVIKTMQENLKTPSVSNDKYQNSPKSGSFYSQNKKKSKQSFSGQDSARKRNESGNEASSEKSVFRDQGIQTETGIDDGKRLTKSQFRTKKLSPTEMGDSNSVNKAGQEVKRLSQSLETVKINLNPPKSSSAEGKKRQQRLIVNTDPLKPPAEYQRGVVPKYIKDRQQEIQQKGKEIKEDKDCPPGHVAIPDAERKETLRMLRQSYADFISELNILPVRSDTLRTQSRKMEIEKQLAKIEEGIKVFSRPKVYVKMDT